MNKRVQVLLKSMDVTIQSMDPVSGGDINESFKVTTPDGKQYFVKINKEGTSKSIITTEAHGLDLMRNHGVKMIPKDFHWAENEKDACLIMPFYEPRPATSEDWMTFFEDLAKMHSISAECFGGEDNYIGRLPQTNTIRNNWAPFYRDNRMQPQLDLATKNGYFSEKDQNQWPDLHRAIASICPIEKPSLIHGDLWNGNIISTELGILLIDPCPHFGHREMDFGMMTLFSGFPVDRFISNYEALIPLKPGWRERMEVYQLYYLLVHLNLFGTAYLPGVKRIIGELM